MKLLRLVLIVICLMVPSIGHAQFVVEESRIEKIVEPGKALVDRLTIHNTSGKTKKVRIYWQDFEYVTPFEGSKEFEPAGSSKHSMANWVTLSHDNGIVQAKGSFTIDYSIKLPADAAGSYYGVLFFEEDDPNNVTETGVKIVMRVGTLFFISTDNNRNHALISDLVISNSTVQVEFSNTGQNILFPQGTYYVLDKDGIPVDRGELVRKYLPAGATTMYEWALADSIPSGAYSMILTYDLGHGYSEVREIDIEKKSDGAVVLKRIRN